MSDTSRKSEQDAAWDRLVGNSPGIPFEDFLVHGIIRRDRSIQVPDEQAEYWTVIGIITGQQVCGIGRFASRAEAEEFARGLKTYPPKTASGPSTCPDTPACLPADTSDQAPPPSDGQSPESTTKFTVMMHRTLVDELDEGFSPMDGLVSIDEMFNELPLLHRALAPTRLRKRAPRKIRVYRGCYDWYRSLGFSYVQIGTTLHVLELWYDENPTLSEMDVILGTGQTEGYKPFGEEPADAQPLSQ